MSRSDKKPKSDLQILGRRFTIFLVVIGVLLFVLDFFILLTTMRLSNRIDSTLARRAQNILEGNNSSSEMEEEEEGERMRA